MTLQFLTDASNVVLVGPNGMGKTMCACNLGYQAILAGHTAPFVTAGQLLDDLAALDSDSTLRRRLRHYAAPDILLIDEVGYLSYSNRRSERRRRHRYPDQGLLTGAFVVGAWRSTEVGKPRPHRQIEADLYRR